MIRRTPFTFIFVMALTTLVSHEPVMSHITAQVSEIVNGDLGKKLDGYFTRAEAFGFSGAILVEKEGEIVLKKGYGWADVSNETVVTPETIFSIESLSKQFTATALLKLESEGKLSLSDPISKFFPDVPEEKRAITIHQLLTHTSGLAHEDDSLYVQNPDRDQMVSMVMSSELSATPSQKFIYSNTGYTLLAAIVEIASGMDFEVYMREKLAGPAGLSTLHFKGDTSKDSDTVFAHTYNRNNDYGPVNDRPYYWGYRGAAGILTSLNQVYSWMKALRSYEILQQKDYTKLTTPQTSTSWSDNIEYAYGWMVIKSDRGTKFIRHGGGNYPAGSTAELRWFPEENLLYIILCNKMIDETGYVLFARRALEEIVFRGETDFPPEYLPDYPSKINVLTGIYTIDDSSSILIGKEHGKLIIGAMGQRGVDILTATPEFNNAESGGEKTNRIKKYIGKPVRELKPFWGDIPADAIISEVLGTVKDRPNSNFSATIIRVQNFPGIKEMRIMWNRNEIRYWMPGGGLPGSMALMPTAENEFVAYDILLKCRRTIRFNYQNGSVKGLTISSGATNIEATKIN